jgi:hypothetical protein
MLKTITIILILLMNSLGSSVTYAGQPDQYLLSQSYFEDKSNAMSITQIEQQAFIPYQKTLTGGYKNGTYWK